MSSHPQGTSGDVPLTYGKVASRSNPPVDVRLVMTTLLAHWSSRPSTWRFSVVCHFTVLSPVAVSVAGSSHANQVMRPSLSTFDTVILFFITGISTPVRGFCAPMVAVVATMRTVRIILL